LYHGVSFVSFVKALLDGCRFDSADAIKIVIVESLHLLTTEVQLLIYLINGRSAKNLEGIMWCRGHVGVHND
jgi:hypothetical protein